MKLNRREFMRATGLARLLAAFGIELPEMEAAEGLPIITEAVMSPDCGMEVSIQAPRLPLVDLTGLGNVSIELYCPIDVAYSWDGDSLPIQHGPARWETHVLIRESRLDETGFSVDDLFGLMMGEMRRYRFSLPGEGRRFEGEGILDNICYDKGSFADEGGFINMRFRGF